MSSPWGRPSTQLCFFPSTSPFCKGANFVFCNFFCHFFLQFFPPAIIFSAIFSLKSKDLMGWRCKNYLQKCFGFLTRNVEHFFLWWGTDGGRTVARRWKFLSYVIYLIVNLLFSCDFVGTGWFGCSSFCPQKPPALRIGALLLSAVWKCHQNSNSSWEGNKCIEMPNIWIALGMGNVKELAED